MTSNKLDIKIKKLFDELSRRKATIDEDNNNLKRSWVTTCSLILDNTSQPINIQVASEQKILEAYTYMLQMSDYKSEAAANLGMVFDNKICGFSVDDWLSDFKKRIAKINIRSKIQTYEVLESRLNAIVSPEQRREMELLAIMAELD